MPGLDLNISATVPADSDDAGLGDDILRLLAVKLQAQLSPISEGVFADRPAPGVLGRRYKATDVEGGIIYVDTGSAWKRDHISANGVVSVEIADLAVITAKLDDEAVTTAKLDDAAVTTAKLADEAVTGAKVNPALKPSGTATAATEALRALGTAAGKAAAGDAHDFPGAVGVGGLATLAGGAIIPERFNAQTGTTYAFVLADQSKLVTFSNAAAIAATIPTNATAAFPVGSTILCANLGAGAVTVSPAGGVTLRIPSGAAALAQYQIARLTKLATNEWLWTNLSGAGAASGATLAAGDWLNPRYIDVNANIAGGGILSGTGTAVFTRIYVPTAQTFDRIGVTGFTASTNHTIRFALYTDSGGRPDQLVFDTGGTLFNNGATATMAATISQALAPGFYWTAVQTDSGGGNPSALMHGIGLGGVTDMPATGPGLFAVAISKARSGAFPASAPAAGGTLITASGQYPVVSLRAA